MGRRLLRFLLPAALMLTAVLLVRRTQRLREELFDLAPSRDPWTPIVESPVSGPRPWVEPIDGACPPTHPIKAKVASHIYHLPGMANYNRTNPDRCYAEETTAETDGFTRAKR